MTRKYRSIALLWMVIGALMVVETFRTRRDDARWEASLGLPSHHTFYDDWIRGPGVVGLAMIVAAVLLLVIAPRFAGRRILSGDRDDLEALRRIEAANARIHAAPVVDAPRARLPGEVSADDDDDRPPLLPSPPRIGDDPFRSPPQRIIVAQPAPVATEAPKVVPVAQGEEPKRLR